MYVRKTEDYWSIHSQYGVECNCATLAEAKANLKDYRDNVPYAVWIEKHREKKEITTRSQVFIARKRKRKEKKYEDN